jgi:dTMP kinase
VSGARRGRLVVLEGAEGVGKTTQLRRLAAALEGAGIAHAVVREPGGTPAGDAIRELLLHAPHELQPATEALLFMASRAELVARVIAPALAAGTVVLADRFFLSTYAYQVAGRGLDERLVRPANALAVAGIVPDVSLLLDLAARDGLARAAQRGAHDRIERAGDDFHARVADAFRGFAEPAWQAAHPEAGPVDVIDAGGTEDEVAGRIRGALAARWPETFLSLGRSHSA